MFQPLKVHLAIVDVKKWDEAVEIVRRFASSPVMVAELTKLKSAGLSQHMFPLTTSEEGLDTPSLDVSDFHQNVVME